MTTKYCEEPACSRRAEWKVHYTLHYIGIEPSYLLVCDYHYALFASSRAVTIEWSESLDQRVKVKHDYGRST